MFDSVEELLAKNRLGEDSTFERKAVSFRGEKCVGPRREELADELVAFANTNEAVIVLGIAEDGGVEGIPLRKLDPVEDMVREVCNDAIKPPLAVRIIRMSLPDEAGNERAILKIDVPRSLFVHKGPGGYFHRLGSSKREMPPELLARLFQQRGQARIIRFDEQAVPESSPADLEESLWRRFLPESEENPRTTLRKMRVLVDDAGSERASVGGLLMCSREPHIWLPGAFIQAVCYRGGERDANYQLDAANLTGPLDEQVRLALAFIRKNMKTMARKEPAREDISQYSIRACFEAVVNAVAHRDYSISGSKIRLHMFDDRLELYSPGSLPNTVSIDSLPLRQATRNELIASLLARCPVGKSRNGIHRDFMMDRRGEGVPIIINETKKLTGAPAIYELIDQTELLLRIPARLPPA